MNISSAEFEKLREAYRPEKSGFKPARKRRLNSIKRIKSEKVVNCYGVLVQRRVRKSKEIIKENPNKGKNNHYFVIKGRPVGYYSLGAKPNFKRMVAYHKYKNYVSEVAKASGLQLPLVATKDFPVRIHSVAYFFNGVHADPENVRKGIVDSLFYSRESKGTGDKYVGGNHEPPRYDAENPRVEITIEFS